MRSFWCLSLAAIAGCATTTTYQPSTTKTYAIDGTVTAPVGGTLLAKQQGSIETSRRWVGVMNSSDGWRTESRPSPDFLKQELVYSGIAGSVIDIMYREYRSGLAAPAFFQTVKYDLTQSRTVTFQAFRMEVIRADNSSITVKILAD